MIIEHYVDLYFAVVFAIGLPIYAVIVALLLSRPGWHHEFYDGEGCPFALSMAAVLLLTVGAHAGLAIGVIVLLVGSHETWIETGDLIRTFQVLFMGAAMVGLSLWAWSSATYVRRYIYAHYGLRDIWERAA